MPMAGRSAACSARTSPAERAEVKLSSRTSLIMPPPRNRGHRVEQRFLAVEDADARGAEHLVTAEGEEVDVERLHVGL